MLNITSNIASNKCFLFVYDDIFKNKSVIFILGIRSTDAFERDKCLMTRSSTRAKSEISREIFSETLGHEDINWRHDDSYRHC